MEKIISLCRTLFKNRLFIFAFGVFLSPFFIAGSLSLSGALVYGQVNGAGTPFGGRILDIQKCVWPFSGFHIELGPPVGGNFIYNAGTSRSFAYGPPAQPQQWLLGMAGGGTECAMRFDKKGRPKDFRSGGLILFHGSSQTGGEL